MSKEKRTADELEALIMAEVRTSPECRNIERAMVILPMSENWDAGFVVHGNELAPSFAWNVITQLQSQFDLLDA